LFLEVVALLAAATADASAAAAFVVAVVALVAASVAFEVALEAEVPAVTAEAAAASLATTEAARAVSESVADFSDADAKAEACDEDACACAAAPVKFSVRDVTVFCRAGKVGRVTMAPVPSSISTVPVCLVSKSRSAFLYPFHLSIRAEMRAARVEFEIEPGLSFAEIVTSARGRRLRWR